MQTDDQILLDQIEQVLQPRDGAIKELQTRTKTLMERTSPRPRHGARFLRHARRDIGQPAVRRHEPPGLCQERPRP
jgi:hypothetical protein